MRTLFSFTDGSRPVQSGAQETPEEVRTGGVPQKKETPGDSSEASDAAAEPKNDPGRDCNSTGLSGDLHPMSKRIIEVTRRPLRRRRATKIRGYMKVLERMRLPVPPGIYRGTNFWDLA